MKTIQITNRFTGSIIFEHSKENNTTKETLLEAIKQDANLIDADLRGADLRNANLRGADLRNANLIGADLIGADLRDANLIGADLRNANLIDADLIGANLRDANLRGANLIGADLRDANLIGANLRDANLRGANIPLFCKWSHSVKDGKIQIGCETRSVEDWEIFLTSDETLTTPRDSQEFKQIKAVISAYIAYLEILNLQIK